MEKDDKKRLMGTWKLLQFYKIFNNGNIVLPLGQHPLGYLTYNGSNIVNVSLCRSNANGKNSNKITDKKEKDIINEVMHKFCSREDFKKNPTGNKSLMRKYTLLMWLSKLLKDKLYTGYSGTYTVDEKSQIIHHNIELSSIKNMVGKDLQRSYLIDDDKLYLSPIEARGKYMFILSWKKLIA